MTIDDVEPSEDALSLTNPKKTVFQYPKSTSTRKSLYLKKTTSIFWIDLRNVLLTTNIQMDINNLGVEYYSTV